MRWAFAAALFWAASGSRPVDSRHITTRERSAFIEHNEDDVMIDDDALEMG